MDLTITGPDGTNFSFECADTWVSKWVCEQILIGKTYPILPFVDDVTVILDAGANCGAATVHLARSYPSAQVHSFEPAIGPRSILERNITGYANVTLHPVGLSDHDGSATLFHGRDDSITGSLQQRAVNIANSEEVDLRDAGRWASEQGLTHIDVMKLDVEGCEVQVLESLAALIPTIKVLYVEYDSRQARRQIDDLLRDTHELYLAMLMALDQGECVYLRKDIADGVDADAELRKIFAT